MNTRAVRGEFPLELSADGRNAEADVRIALRKSRDFNSINALIEAIDSGFESAAFRLGNMQHKMQNRVAGLKRTGPIAFECGRIMRRLRLVIRGRLGAGYIRKNRGEKQKRKRWCKAKANGLQTEPPQERIP